jgi:hypothetical protein
MRAFDQSTLSVISLDVLESLEKLLQLLLLLRHLCCLCPFSLRHEVSLLSLWTCQQPHLHHTRATSLSPTEARLSLLYSDSSPIQRPAINTRRPLDPLVCKSQERLLHRKEENQVNRLIAEEIQTGTNGSCDKPFLGVLTLVGDGKGGARLLLSKLH